MEKEGLDYWTRKYVNAKTVEEANKANWEMTKILMKKEKRTPKERTTPKVTAEEYVYLNFSEACDIDDVLIAIELARQEEREKIKAELEVFRSCLPYKDKDIVSECIDIVDEFSLKSNNEVLENKDKGGEE